MPLPAHAQTQPAAAAATSNTIEELVVTAEKRSQSLQDVPVAISAYTSEKRDLLGINTIQDMTNFTPGLEYSSQLDRISLRGVGRLTNVQAADPGVATYSDGVYTSSTVEAGKTPLFVDRVEVLRGPQGTLYGRNSIGGAINVLSKRPTEELYGEVRATVGNYGRTLLEAAVSGPLAPDLQFRLGGNWEKQRDGYYKNIVPGMPQRRQCHRPVLRRGPTSGEVRRAPGRLAEGLARRLEQRRRRSGRAGDLYQGPDQYGRVPAERHLREPELRLLGAQSPTSSTCRRTLASIRPTATRGSSRPIPATPSRSMTPTSSRPSGPTTWTGWT